jgi:hypothetical protein
MRSAARLHARALTAEFYNYVSLGGVIGGVHRVAVLIRFNAIIEHPLLLAATFFRATRSRMLKPAADRCCTAGAGVLVIAFLQSSSLDRALLGVIGTAGAVESDATGWWLQSARDRHRRMIATYVTSGTPFTRDLTFSGHRVIEVAIRLLGTNTLPHGSTDGFCAQWRDSARAGAR